MKSVSVFLLLMLSACILGNACSTGSEKAVNYVFGKTDGELLREDFFRRPGRNILFFGLLRTDYYSFAANETIGGIELFDLQNRSSEDREAIVTIYLGGIGSKDVTLKFRNIRGYGFHYQIKIYAETSGEKDENKSKDDKKEENEKKPKEDEKSKDNDKPKEGENPPKPEEKPAAAA